MSKLTFKDYLILAKSERPQPTLFWDIVTILMLLAAIAIWSLIVAGFQNW